MTPLHASFGVSFELWAVDSVTGEICAHRPPTRNLITDAGLDQIVSTNLNALIGCLHFGTGDLITQRSTGALQVNATGGRLYCTGNFFEPGDVGRLFKFNGGTEVRVTAYVSSTEVATSHAGDIAADSGKMWYANLIALVNRIGWKNAGGGSTRVKTAATTFTYTSNFLTDAFGATTVIKELGWGVSGGSTPLFGLKEIIPFAIGVGQQLKVDVTLYVTFSPSTAEAQTPIGTGLDAAGSLSIDTMDPDQIKPGRWCDKMWAAKNTFGQTPGAADAPENNASGLLYPGSAGPTMAPYIAGSREANWSWTIPANTMGPGSVHGLIWGWQQTYNDWPVFRTLSYKLTTPAPITLNDKLIVQAKQTWDRVLTN